MAERWTGRFLVHVFFFAFFAFFTRFVSRINYGVSKGLPSNHRQWLIPFAIQLVPAGIFFLGIWYIRESPRWLMGRNRRDEAIDNLAVSRNSLDLEMTPQLIFIAYSGSASLTLRNNILSRRLI